MRAESKAIIERYGKRRRTYSWLDPDVFMSRLEFDRRLIDWLRAPGRPPAESMRLLDVGCGSGANLLQFLRLGFRPDRLYGIELQDQRAQQARNLLPAAVRVDTVDATEFNADDESFDVVFQSLVFSSILDDDTQAALAGRMWRLAKPGGGVLWYDFTYDNPANPDVRGVTRRRIAELFPEAKISGRRVTLAPPISRRITRLHPSLYSWLNLPFLRTHLLCWLEKPAMEKS